MTLTAEQKQLIEEHYKLIYHFANIYRNKFRRLDYAEIVDACTDALFRTSRTFDETKGEFSTMMGAITRNEIYRLERDKNYAKRKLNQEALSINKPIPRLKGEGAVFFDNAYGNPDTYSFEDKEFIRLAAQQLTDREKELIHLYYYEDKNQNELAEMFGYSQMHISRLIRKGVKKMQEYKEIAGL